MTERDLTAQEPKRHRNIAIATNLPPGWTWLRAGDSGRRQFNKTGYDGLLIYKSETQYLCLITEVKLDRMDFTESEAKTAHRIKPAPYLVLTYRQSIHRYLIVDYNGDFNDNGTLYSICHNLLKHFGGKDGL
jgi:hypothetical protein